MFRLFPCRLSIIMLMLLWAISCALAAPVDQMTAQFVGQSWVLTNYSPARGFSDWQPVAVAGVRQFSDKDGTTLAYVIDLDPEGFLIVAADDAISPVLAFSSRGSFSVDDDVVLSDLLAQDIPVRLAEAERLSVDQQASVKDDWDALRFPGAPTLLATAGTNFVVMVNPLLTTEWGQGSISAPYTYNALTPDHCATGCVATALGMIVRYFRYPASASGSNYIYVNNQRRRVSFSSTYSYDLMPDQLLRTSRPEEIQAVATLLRDCGTAVGMKYTRFTSTAYTENVPNVLKQTFHYVAASWKAGSDRNWQAVLLDELNNGYPVQLAIRDTARNYGHALVCDGWGYEGSKTYFHLNFGWEGDDNAYYLIPNFRTSSYPAFWNSLYGYVYNIRPTMKADKYEPDNTAQTAVTITDGAVQSHSIHTVGDVDWAQFTLTERCAARIETTGGSGDTEMWLYGPDDTNRLLAHNDNIGTSRFSLINMDGASTLAAGTYYIRVSEKGNNELIPSYTLSLTIRPTDRPVATPTFNPSAPGTFTNPISVRLACATQGATIRYTTNGSEPTTSSRVYFSPIPISVTSTIKARAYKNGMLPSDIATATYTKQETTSTRIILSGNPLSGTATGAILKIGLDTRYYIDIPAGQGGKWTIWVQQNTLTDSILYLYRDAKYTYCLNYNDNCHVVNCMYNHTSRHSRIDCTLAGGVRYYLKVKGISTAMGTYTIKVKRAG